MFNLRYRSHRVLRDFFETGSKREIVDWKAYGYKRAKSCYQTVRTTAMLLRLPVYVAFEKNDAILFREDI